MQTWNSLLGLQGVRVDENQRVRIDESEKAKEISESLTAGLQSALAHVAGERAAGKIVYPPDADVFNAFKLTPFDTLKVVILGQDPYHGPNQSHGLCFSVVKGNKIPPSLRNIYKELAADIHNFVVPSHGDLSYWAEQGILLLNTVLTVEQAQAHSHKKIGWEQFTDGVISTINSQCENVIFLLWGAPAQKKAILIDEQRHTILTAIHPSPLSAHRGFFGCKHFSKTNQILSSQGRKPIDWQPR